MSAPQVESEPPLTERQKRRRFEKAVVKSGFRGTVIINSNPHSASQQAHLEYVNPSHWGDEHSRMVFWAKGSTGTTDNIEFDKISGLGIISQTSPDPDQWIWSAFRVMSEIPDNHIAEILAVATSLQIAKEKCDELSGPERPWIVVVHSGSADALRRIQHWGDDGADVRGKMCKAAKKVVERGLVATHFLRERGIEVELRWIPDGCDVEGMLEAVYAAGEGVKYVPEKRGPQAFMRDVQEVYKRKMERRRRRGKKRECRMKEVEERKEKLGAMQRPVVSDRK